MPRAAGSMTAWAAVRGIFYTIGNFISYRIKTSGGSHCGGKEDVAYATRRAGNLRLPGESRKRDSFYQCIFEEKNLVSAQNPC